MQEYATGHCVTAQANAYAGPLSLREEGLVPRVFFQSARNLGASAKAIVSRVRAAGSPKVTPDSSPKQKEGDDQHSECTAEADFRADLRHFLDPTPTGQRPERNN